ncbi:hypothetical protein B7463_g3218, partial [Scytalidium lignicola]
MDYNGDWHGGRRYYEPGYFPGQNVPEQTSFPPHSYRDIRDQRYYEQPLPPNNYQHPSYQHHSNSPMEYDGVSAQRTRPTSDIQQPSPYGKRKPGSSADAPSDFTSPEVNAPPPYSSKVPIAIAIPQMNKGRGVPFQRLYVPILREHGISEREFVDFIDTLNVVSAASPPLKVLDLAGGLISMVPHHWAVMAGNAMKLVSMGGTALVSKNRTDSFMSESNQHLFAPRGLRMRLITTDALLATIKFPPERAITLPLDAHIPLDQQPKLHARLLQRLRGYVNDTVPTSLPPVGADNMLDKWSADQVSRDINKIDKTIMKDSEKRMKHDMKHADSNGAPRVKRSKSLDRKIRKTNKEADKKLDSGRYSPSQVEEEREEALSRLLNKEKRGRKAEKHGKKDADERFVEKLLWIFINYN